MNAFWASENCDVFIVFRSSQPRENTAENSNSERPSFRGADHVGVREVNCRNANRLYGMESLPSEGVGEIRSARVIVGNAAIYVAVRVAFWRYLSGMPI